MYTLRILLAAGIALAAALESPSSPYFTEYLRRLAVSASPATRIDSTTSALVIVDMQADFVGEFAYTDAQVAAGESPCAAFFGAIGAAANQSCFGVREGDTAAAEIAGLLGQHRFATVVASMDGTSGSLGSWGVGVVVRGGWVGGGGKYNMHSLRRVRMVRQAGGLSCSTAVWLFGDSAVVLCLLCLHPRTPPLTTHFARLSTPHRLLPTPRLFTLPSPSHPQTTPSTTAPLAPSPAWAPPTRRRGARSSSQTAT